MGDNVASTGTGTDRKLAWQQVLALVTAVAPYRFPLACGSRGDCIAALCVRIVLQGVRRQWAGGSRGTVDNIGTACRNDSRDSPRLPRRVINAVQPCTGHQEKLPHELEGAFVSLYCSSSLCRAVGRPFICFIPTGWMCW